MDEIEATEGDEPGCTLLRTTLTMLRERRRSLKTIAKGADVKYDWLQSLVNGRIADPGVTKIVRLHNYLIQPDPPSTPPQ